MRFTLIAKAGLCCLGLLLASTAQADVFINEIHYDNAGADSNEKVQVIAPAGTSCRRDPRRQLCRGDPGKP